MEIDGSARMCMLVAFSDVQGLKRKLSNKLSIVDDGEANAEEDEDDWQVTLVQAEEKFLNTLFNFLLTCKLASTIVQWYVNSDANFQAAKGWNRMIQVSETFYLWLLTRLGSAWGCGGDLNLRPSHFHTCPLTSAPQRYKMSPCRTVFEPSFLSHCSDPGCVNSVAS